MEPLNRCSLASFPSDIVPLPCECGGSQRFRWSVRPNFVRKDEKILRDADGPNSPATVAITSLTATVMALRNVFGPNSSRFQVAHTSCPLLVAWTRTNLSAVLISGFVDDNQPSPVTSGLGCKQLLIWALRIIAKYFLITHTKVGYT